MNRQDAIRLIRETFENPFDEARFARFARELLNELHTGAEAQFSYTGQYIKQAYRDYVRRYDRLGKYTDPDGYRLDVLVVYLGKSSSLERARTMQRNFVADYLRGRGEKDAALVAYVVKGEPNWRFSFVRMDYQRQVDEATGKVRIEEKLTPARRFSFLVGAEEPNHTAQQQLLPVLQDDAYNPTLEQLEEAFSIEKVSKAFFDHYKERFLELREELDRIRSQNAAVAREFDARELDTAQFAKKLLGQIVFLYFLQKKGWLGVEKSQLWGSGPKNFLSALFRKGDYENFFDEVLEPLFYEALAIQRPDNWYPRLRCKIPFLNGGLFEPIGGYDWRGVSIPIDNAVFANIFETFDLYNFTVREDEPLEKEVAVDPEMLGKVFERLLDVRDRKSKGAFYTPREIVHYMCQESLINYLDTAVNVRPDPLVERSPAQVGLFSGAPPRQEVLTAMKYEPIVPRADIETLIRKGELALQHEAAREAGTKSYQALMPESVRAHAAELDAALAEIKVCDPAVGSGAFPVGMMHEIVRARLALTPYIHSQHRAERSRRSSRAQPISRPGEVEARTPYAFKRHAIQESLYGVDIDPAAVDIAKLRLWLSLVVDEEDYEHIKPLPNLDYKIVAGNSLLGVEKNLFNHHLFADLETRKQEYFEATDPTEKARLRDEIDSLIAQLTDGKTQFDFEIYFSEVFREKGGFDVVIGNPPYIDSEEMVKSGQKQLRDFIARSFRFAKGNWDIYIAFFEIGLRLLNNHGMLAYITPDKWLSKPFGKELRKNILATIQAILIAGRDIFLSVNVDSIVSFISTKKTARIRILEHGREKITLLRIVDKDILKPPYAFDLLFSDNLDFLLRLDSNPHRLLEIATCENACATSDAYKLKPLVYDVLPSAFSSKKHFRVVNTGTIDRFVTKWGRRAMVYLGKKYLYPVVDKSEFTNHFVNSYGRKATRPKLLIKGLTLLHACLDKKGDIIPGKSTLVVLSDDINTLKFLLGLINSKLSFFYISEKYSASSYNTGINFTKDMINDLPLPILSQEAQYSMVRLVDQVLAVKYQNSSADTSALEAEIDCLVYQLYGLTEDEIALVEESVGR